MEELMSNYKILGKGIPRIDTPPKATGEALYTADIKLPNMLVGKVLHSPLAHAKILNIDTSKAQKLPGVKAVITRDDTFGEKWGVFKYTRDHQLIAFDKVRFIGEEVAAVAAVDEDTALEALDLIKVEYEPLPAVFNAEEAMQDGAPLIHEDHPNNINIHVNIDVGDVERAFKGAYLVREDKFTSNDETYGMLEPYGVLANYHSDGSIEIWMPNASPHTKAKSLSNLLHIPLNKVIVRRPEIGGAFGGRSDIFPLDFITSLLSIKARRPVKIIYTREESMICTRQVHSMVMQVKTGVKKDGKILAQDIKVIMDGGGYSSTGPIAASVPFLVWEETYKLENVRLNSYRVYTNKPIRGMYRCHGRAFLGGLGMQLDIIAEDLGIDPVDIRIKNALNPGDMQATKSKVYSCGLKEAVKSAAEKIGWEEKRGKLPFGKGVGMGANGMMCGFPMGIRGGSSCFVKFNEDGYPTIISGVIDNGQGNYHAMVQIASEVLGVPPEEIHIVAGDTEVTTLDVGAYSQAAVVVSGNAVKKACEDAKAQILKLASEMLNCSEEKLDIENKIIFSKKDKSKQVPLHKVIRKGLIENRHVMGRGHYMPEVSNDREWVKNPVGQQATTFSFGANAVEVEVDTDTGEVKIINAVGFHDCGFPINIKGVEGQYEGSIASGGVGSTLKEEHLFKNGKVLNPDFLEYKIPTSLDVPENVYAGAVITNDPKGPFGAKEAGLFGSMNSFQAIANAIYDAVGVWIKDFPITPDKILKALEEKKKNES
jgi:CO/xanthine dehydrogenase Mo-binding subunit